MLVFKNLLVLSMLFTSYHSLADTSVGPYSKIVCRYGSNTDAVVKIVRLTKNVERIVSGGNIYYEISYQDVEKEWIDSENPLCSYEYKRTEELILRDDHNAMKVSVAAGESTILCGVGTIVKNYANKDDILNLYVESYVKFIEIADKKIKSYYGYVTDSSCIVSELEGE